jgi:hypothetical protein
MADPLDRELKKYKELLPTLVAEEGKFALIHGAELKGVYEAYLDALSAGYKLAGLNPFLVKRINQVEVNSYFTRDTGSECRI